ncbi:MAG: 2-oxoacid:acceptor oxidoreductase family protein [Bacteroidales bacterium]
MQYCSLFLSHILEQSPITSADYVIFIDNSLLSLQGLEKLIYSNVNKNTKFLVNAKSDLKLKQNSYYLDASKIAGDVIGKDFANVVLLGAFAKLTGIVSLKNLEKAFNEAFANKKDYLNKNIKAMHEGYNSLKV